MGWLYWALAAFVFAIFGQSLILRVTPLRNGMVAFVVAGVPIGLALMAMSLPRLPADRAMAGTLLYAFLCEVWMFIFSATFSSISANLILHLRKGSLCLADIDHIYDNREMIQRRITWLNHIGAVVARDGQLTPTEKGRRLARLFDALRGFFGHQ